MGPNPVGGNNSILFRVDSPTVPAPMDVAEESVPPSETASTVDGEERPFPDEPNQFSGTVTPSSGLITPSEDPSVNSNPPPPPHEVAGALGAIGFPYGGYRVLDMPRPDSPPRKKPGESEQAYEERLQKFIDWQRGICLGESFL